MANIITAVRLICAPVLFFCPMFSNWFYAVFILGGVSDVLDGAVARHFGKETKFGARLDTIADVAFAAAVIIKVVQSVCIPLWLIIWIVCIAAVKCINIICGFVLFGRFVSEHTKMNKICGVLLFLIPLYIGIFPKQPATVPLVAVCSAATVAAVMEGYLICKGKEIN